MRGEFAPPTLAWLQAAGHMLKSPRASARRSSLTVPPRLETGSRTPITLQMLTQLALMIEYLDENHRREEGLYRREGSRMETLDLLEYCLTRDLPDLALFSPHSITAVVKHCLLDRFEPLVPYAISKHMMEASEATTDTGRQLLFARFKQVSSASREFLKLFLLHLHRVNQLLLTSILCISESDTLCALVKVSVTPACRMSAKNLAAQVGLALVCPSEDKKLLASSKDSMYIRKDPSTSRYSSMGLTCPHHIGVAKGASKKQRQYVAQILIEQATSLPYDCATEMELETIPDRPNPSDKQELEQVAVSNSSPAYSEANNDTYSNVSGEEGETPAGDAMNTQILPKLENSCLSVEARINGGKCESLFVRCKDTEVPVKSPRAATIQNEGHAVSTSPSLATLTVPSARKDSIIVEDYDSDVADGAANILPPTLSSDTKTHKIAVGTRAGLAVSTCAVQAPPAIDCTLDDSSLSMATAKTPCNDHSRQRQYGKKSPVVVRGGRLRELGYADSPRVRTSLTMKRLSFVNEFRGIFSRRLSKSNTISRADKTQMRCEGVATKEYGTIMDATAAKGDFQSVSRSENIGNKATVTRHIQDQCDRGCQTLAPQSIFTDDKAVNTDDPEPEANSDRETTRVHLPHSAAEIFQRKLLDIRMLLQTADSAVEGSSPITEASRALHQLHTQILRMIDNALQIVAASQEGDPDFDGASQSTLQQSNKEFLDFLEIQSKTQVKILEVEVKAGQELTRLLKTQHQQELKELEQEMTALRVTCTETERLSAELRAELRKCRNELACQVAYSTKLNREKRDADERLAACEMQKQTKELALAQATEELTLMKKVAADAQACILNASIIRETSDFSVDNQRKAEPARYSRVPESHVSTIKSGSALDDGSVLRADKLLESMKHPRYWGQSKQQGKSGSAIAFERARMSYQEKATSINAMTLERFKRKISKDIQEQITATKLALEEIESYEPSESSIEADQDELCVLKETLGRKSAAMHEAMDESRQYLEQLLSGSYSSTNNNSSFSETETTSKTRKPWRFNTASLLEELALLVEVEPTTSDINNQRIPSRESHDATSADATDGAGWEILGTTSSGTESTRNSAARREPQSEVYRSWMAQRTQRASELTGYRDRRSLEQAQQSMRSFNQTLAAVHKGERGRTT